MITQAVVDKCGLSPTSLVEVHGVHGKQLAESYLVSIGLPNMVAFYSVRVTKGDMQGADVLIGMDIISQGDFSETNASGETKFSYRTPSIAHIDYVEQAKKQTADAKTPTTRAERRRNKLGRK